MIKGALKSTLTEILDAREERASFQKDLIKKHNSAVISFMLNIPGECKVFDYAVSAFEEGIKAIINQLKRYNIIFDIPVVRQLHTGYEGYFAINTDAVKVKQYMKIIEERHPLGRFFDIDVLNNNGELIKSGNRNDRKCFICGKSVWECAPKREHSAEELFEYVYNKLKQYFIDKNADIAASKAIKALNYEVLLSPKPGLVDRLNNGAHNDMDIFTFISSSSVLYSYFIDCYKTGATFGGTPDLLLKEIRYAGMMAEETMFRETQGVNTHKGAVFSFGIMCTALGYSFNNNNITPEAVSKLCSVIALETLSELEYSNTTNGYQAYIKHGIVGARGEAASGFVNAFRCYDLLKVRVLPNQSNFENAALYAFLIIMSEVDDTNMISRGSKQIQDYYKDEIKKSIIKEVNHIEYLKKLDTEYIKKNLSPGGCADILALGIFLYFIFTDM